jgi:hypothetical protein
MGSGMFVFAEWDSLRRQSPEFQQAIANLEKDAIAHCTDKWYPKKTPDQAFDYAHPLTPGDGKFGRTSILPALFDDHTGNPMAHWRQTFTAIGHQRILQGVGAGETMPEDIVVAWAGLAFPEKNINLTEIRWQIGDRKYGRENIEGMYSFNKPALVFDEGLIIDEETSFEFDGYVKGPLPLSQGNMIYQRIVPLGAAYFRIKDKVLGAPGSAIT